MNLKMLLTILVTLCAPRSLCAQQATITGHVKNEAGNPLNGSTVLLYRFTDSLLVKTAITDKEGKYALNEVGAGRYFIKVFFTGYFDKLTPAFVLTGNENFFVPPVILAVTLKQMQQVKVTASYQKPIIEVTTDKTILNVEGSINATGSNAFELLQKSPGVVTDKDDNIIIKAKNGVRIYIDGRPAQLEGADLAAYLRSINSAAIQSIEIISNPSARYDAAGNAGIINIKLKKNKTMGLSGSAGAGLNIATHLKTNASASLNYRNKKINLFSNYNFTRNNNDNTFDLYRVQNDTLYNQHSFQNIKGSVNNIKAGADIFISGKSTAGFIYTGNFTDNTTYSYSRTPSSAVSTGAIDRILYATNTIPANIKNGNFNINYHFEDTTGQEINVDIDHGVYQSRKTSYQPNDYKTPSETLLYEKNYRNITPIDILINTQKIDYVTPFKNGKLSAGAKLSFVKTDNAFTLYNVVNGQNIIDPASSNTFLYKENINAGYVSYFTPVGKKIKLQAGLRVENTVNKSLLKRLDGTIQPNDSTGRNYTDFFPGVAFTLAAGKYHNFNLNYGRRIDRPNYSDLNPFETRVDELTYIKGNTDLRPQYTNSFTLTHTYKSIYITAIGYSHISDFSTYIIDSAKVTQVFITKKNLASQDVISINFSVPADIKKWLSFYGSMGIYNSRYHANFGAGKIVNIEVTSFNFNAENTFKLSKGFTGELSGFYNSPSVSAGTFKSKQLGSIDAGIEKKCFKDNATIKLTFTDILHTLKWRGESNYDGTHMLATSIWESRQIRLNFSYRFGRSQVKQSRRRVTGNEEESDRAATHGGFGN